MKTKPELAEFIPVFLKAKIFEDREYFELHGINYWYKDVFTLIEVAPILAHLAERELAKNDIHWYASFRRGKYFFQIIYKDDDSAGAFTEHDNKFYALWSAIEATGEKG